MAERSTNNGASIVVLQTSRTEPRTSAVLTRILDYRKSLDYVWLTLFAILPVIIAYQIGVLEKFGDDYDGYGTKNNFTSLIFVLPVAAFALRRIARKMGPVLTEEMSASCPPVVDLIQDDEGKRIGYRALRLSMLSPKNLILAVLVTLVIHGLDMAQLGRVYLSPASEYCFDKFNDKCLHEREDGLEKDWSIAYLHSSNEPGKWSNLGLVISAYSVQFVSILIGILLTILMFRHNLFFLSRIYQRRRVAPENEFSYIHLDLDDEEKCFGFRSANSAFNVQLLALAAAGLATLFTRFSNVQSRDVCSSNKVLTCLFPDAGQILVIVACGVALLIVSMPVLVKLLPRMPLSKVEPVPALIVDYLREFLSDKAWAFGKDTRPEEINSVAAQFAKNAFWPTGNNRATQLYFFSFWVFLIALVPDPRAIVSGLSVWVMPLNWAILGIIASAVTWCFFRLLRLLLTYVDERLVEAPENQGSASHVIRRRKLPIGMFISYRRSDSAAYTGRLYDSLSGVFDKDRVFMDLDDIDAGVDFVDALDRAINAAKAMLVVIGPDWLTAARGDGPFRIQDPADFVHQEVAQGLNRGIRVFPVLVGGAKMPSEDDLPTALKGLATRNAIEISDSRWASDVERLVGDLKTIR